MTRMTVYPICKINIGLHVLSRRPDGYHELETLFYPVRKLTDELSAEIMPQCPAGTCSLQLSGRKVEGDPAHNLVVQAYHDLAGDFRMPAVHFHLVKRIPMQAGLGGGSSDAAYALRLLSTLCELGLTTDELRRRAARLGADCAFFVDPQPMLATGIGERLSPFPLPLSGKALVVLLPDDTVSTARAYSALDRLYSSNRTCSRAGVLMQSLLDPLSAWPRLVTNDFERVVLPSHPKIVRMRDLLLQSGATYVSMSGSGAAVYGLFDKMPDLTLLPSGVFSHSEVL